eukprot:scaffold43409_cov41-Cyclotella_meneghiniana.AAC.5
MPEQQLPRRRSEKHEEYQNCSRTGDLVIYQEKRKLNIIGPRWKVDKLNKDIIPSLEVDVFMLNELQRDWRATPKEEHLTQVLLPGVAKHGVVVANNTTERSLGRDQPGGTGILALGRMSDLVTETGQDTTGLARWVWITIIIGLGIRTRLVAAYNPVRPNNGKGNTVFEQNQRLYQRLGHFQDPAHIFQCDLL